MLLSHLQQYQQGQGPRLEEVGAPHVLEHGRCVGEHMAVHMGHSSEARVVRRVGRYPQDLVRHNKPDGMYTGVFRKSQVTTQAAVPKLELDGT